MSASRTDRRPRGELARVLVVDDEADIRELLDITLARMGLAVDTAGSLREARERLEHAAYQLCLTDMRLPDGSGLDVVATVIRTQPKTPVAVITAFGSTENAIAALKAGAFDYLAKPLALDQLRTLVKSALNLPGEHGGGADQPSRLIGESPAMEQVRGLIDKLARSQAPVYISGESGCGKELAARLIHAGGARSSAPFVPVNCGAIPENLMESEFFGYRKGAFTGADADHEGFFQAANGGTLFLDEVADLPLGMQVKLLRAIQEKRVRQVGSTAEQPVDVRIISATHRNLRERVEQGSFRQDLYYRLNVIELRMPPLRERSEDVPLLVMAALARLGSSYRMSAAASQALAAYSFPGNVRELENILERATALCAGNEIALDDLQLLVDEDAGVVAGGEGLEGLGGGTLDDYLNRIERQIVVDALEKTGGNRTAAARLLGVTFRSLRYRIERLGIDA